MEEIVWGDVLKDFAGFPVPLGVCLMVVFAMLFIFKKIQDGHIVHYKFLLSQKTEIEESYRQQIDSLEKRIEKLQSENQSLDSQVKTLSRKLLDCETQRERR